MERVTMKEWEKGIYEYYLTQTCLFAPMYSYLMSPKEPISIWETSNVLFHPLGPVECYNYNTIVTQH